LAGLAVAAVAGALAAWWLKPVPERPSWRLHLAPPPEVGGVRSGTRIAPDGHAIAFVARERLWVQELAASSPREVPRGEGASQVTWSPDSRSLAFNAGSQLWRTLPNGDTQLIGELPEALGASGGIAWTADDTIVYGTGDGGLFVLPVSGGTPRPLLEPDRPRESDFHEPIALPGGRGIVFIVHRVPEGIDTIDLYANGRRRTLFQRPEAWLSYPKWSTSGHLLFTQLDAGGVWALAVGPEDLEPRGEPFLVASGASDPSISDNGILLVSKLARTGEHQLARVDLDGRVVETYGDAVGHADGASFSPDGKRLAVCIFEAKRASVWIYDLERGSRVRLFSNVSCGSKNGGVAWSPDGERMAIADLSSENILARRTDGADAPAILTEGKQPEWSRDGRWLVFTRDAAETKADLWKLDLEGGGAPEPFVTTPASEEQPRLSPDGRFLAYVSDESGRGEVYLRPFPRGEGRWQVSVAGGDLPRWSPKGDRLSFVYEDNKLLAVDVTLGATPLLSDPRPVLPGSSGRFGLEHGYDVAPDGESLGLVELGGGEEAGGDLTLISPWPDERAGR
jgi:serine/threonine-protein kinase